MKERRPEKIVSVQKTRMSVKSIYLMNVGRVVREERGEVLLQDASLMQAYLGG